MVIANKEPIKFGLSRGGIALPSVPLASSKPHQLVFTLEEEAGTDVGDLLVELLTRAEQPCPDLSASVRGSDCPTNQ
eukprot:4915014-Prymnesium_polylepis.1